MIKYDLWNYLFAEKKCGFMDLLACLVLCS